jgi:hypothetical protein
MSILYQQDSPDMMKRCAPAKSSYHRRPIPVISPWPPYPSEIFPIPALKAFLCCLPIFRPNPFPLLVNEDLCDLLDHYCCYYDYYYYPSFSLVLRPSPSRFQAASVNFPPCECVPLVKKLNNNGIFSLFQATRVYSHGGQKYGGDEWSRK